MQDPAQAGFRETGKHLNESVVWQRSQLAANPVSISGFETEGAIVPRIPAVAERPLCRIDHQLRVVHQADARHEVQELDSFCLGKSSCLGQFKAIVGRLRRLGGSCSRDEPETEHARHTQSTDRLYGEGPGYCRSLACFEL